MSSKIKASLFNHLIEAERQLLEPEVRQSERALDALLDDEFIEIAANGTSFNKYQVLTRLPTEVVPQFYNQHFKGRMLSIDVAQISYQAAYRRSARAEFNYSLRSRYGVKIAHSNGKWCFIKAHRALLLQFQWTTSNVLTQFIFIY